MKGLLSYVAFLLAFVFAGYVNAQSLDLTSGSLESYTQPSEHDLNLIENAVARCDILSEVVHSIDGNELSSQEIFDKLQQTNEDGDLLIDSRECGDAILEFVSSLCSSGELVNNTYCNRLGIKKIDDADKSEDNYKTFGESAFGNLDLYDWDNSRFASNNVKDDTKEVRFSVAQSLFLLTPVRGLKLARPASKILGSKIKPVLSGAMLILASLGLSSCDDLTGPEQACSTGLSNYFLIEKTSDAGNGEGPQSGCIRLPDVEVTFTDSDGNPISGSSQESKEDMHINIQFDSIVSYIDENGRGSKLSKSLDLYDMVEVNYEDTVNLVGDFVLLDDFEVGVRDGKSYITIKPPALLDGFYPEGSHTITVKNYVRRKDLSLISGSNNINEYLQVAQEQAVFYSGQPSTPCTEGLPGYFQLEYSNGSKLKCIVLPQVAFNYTSGGVTLAQPDGSNDVVIDIVFDSKIVYLGRDNANFFSWEELSLHRLLQMVSVKRDGRELVGDGEIGIANLSFSLTSGGNTYIRIMPPENGWAEGDYEISIEDYAKEGDANLIVNSEGVGESGIARYLVLAKKYSVFLVGEISNNCTTGRLGYFQLYNEDESLGKCIKVPEPIFTHSDFGGINNVITILFDSEIAYIDETGWQEMVAGRLLGMLEITPVDGGANLVGKSIGLEQLRVNFSNGQHSIIIGPPIGGYSEDSYKITLKNYTRVADAGFIFKSENTADYVNGVSVATYFYVGTQTNPCTLGQPGYFQLVDGEGNRVRCIKLPEVSFRNTNQNGQNPVGARDIVIDIAFDADGSEVAYIGPGSPGGEFYTWEELSSHRLLQMVSIKQDSTELIGDEINSANLSFGTTSSGDSYIRVMPPAGGYDDGDYEVSIRNYAKVDDANLIYTVQGSDGAGGIDRYLDQTTKYFVFNVGDPETPCDRHEIGYFELELGGSRTRCIKLPVVDVSYSSSTGSDDVVITVDFNTKVAYIDQQANWEELKEHHVLDMVEVKLRAGDDNLIGDTIGLEQISVSKGSRITINPPFEKYVEGIYEVMVKNYAKTSDASLVSSSDNRAEYLTQTSRTSAFYVGAGETPCTRGEAGWFQLEKDDNNLKCIERPIATFSYTTQSGNPISKTPGSVFKIPSDAILTITFDGEVSYIGERGWQTLDANRVFDMVDIRALFNCDTDSDDYTDCTYSDVNEIGTSITSDKILVGKTGKQSFIRIYAPDDGYNAVAEVEEEICTTVNGEENCTIVTTTVPAFDYRIELENYVYTVDAPWAIQADNLTGDDGFLPYTITHEIFHLDMDECDAEVDGYFTLRDSTGIRVGCIGIPTAEISFMDSDDVSIAKRNGIYTVTLDHTIEIIFDGLIAKIDSSAPAEELTNRDISDIVDIRKLTCTTNIPDEDCTETTANNVLATYYDDDQDEDRSRRPYRSRITLEQRTGSSFSSGEYYKIILKDFYYAEDYDHLSGVIEEVDNITGNDGYLESLDNHIEYYRTTP